MKAKTERSLKVAGVIGASVALVGAGLVGGFVLDDPAVVIQKEIEYQTQIEYQDVLVEVEKIVEIESPELVAELEAAKELADARLEALDDSMYEKSLILDSLNDHDGEMEWVLDDLDDDELDKVVDRIIFVKEVKELAAEEVKAELADELDHLIVDGVELDESDITRVRVNDDLDEMSLEDVDFEDGDATVRVSGTFEQDHVKYDFEVDVEFRDGDVDEFDVVSVSERV